MEAIHIYALEKKFQWFFLTSLRVLFGYEFCEVAKIRARSSLWADKVLYRCKQIK